MRTNDAAQYDYVFLNAIHKDKGQSFRPVNDYNLDAVALPQGARSSAPVQKDASCKHKSKSLI